MNPSTQVLALAGPAGPIDVALDLPAGPPAGVAVIAHPHPLYGGTRDNKVVQTLARALVQSGYACWRPNFRGVGATAGVHDEGRGETDDLIAVVDEALAHAAAAGTDTPPLMLAGFSFGAFVQSRVAQALAERGRSLRGVVLIAPAVSRFEVASLGGRALVVHGELDDVVPLSAVLDWARPQDLPVVVVPGADHFFHRRLTLLKRIVSEWVRGGEPRPAPAGA